MQTYFMIQYFFAEYEHIFTDPAGVAVLLAIITFFSTPILTTIFGDGSTEVYEQ